MNIIPPPPPISTTIPQTTSYNNPINTPTTTVTPNDVVSPPSPSSSIIIVMIVISSAIILTVSLYFLIRFLSRRYNHNHNRHDVVSHRHDNNTTDHVVIPLDHNNNNAVISLPLFTFSSLTGKIASGDCAVCLSRFESTDQLRLLPLCCHAFHAPCIDAWLKSNLTCPLCRSSVNPTDEDVFKRLGSGSGGGSFRIEIGNVSRRRDPSETDRRSYSVGSYEYVVDNDGYEIAVEPTHRREVSEDKEDSTAERNLAAEVGSGRRNWLRDYVDRVSVSISSRTTSFRGGSGRLFGGSSRRSEAVDDFEVNNNNNGSSRIGEEISELFRWFSGV